ncbi:MAG: glycine cleavage system aminomethyltransferase GcvT [bacterium]
MAQALKSVPLEAAHVAAGGKMVEFAGFNMPVQYTGIKEEHLAVRNAAGLFDVSHMGEVEFRGPNALAAVDHLVTNDISKLVDGQAMYTAMCHANGGIVDDLVVYRLGPERVLVCVNAANRDKDFAHMRAHTTLDVDLVDRGDEFAQLAIQGPNAVAIVDALTDIDATAIGTYHAADGNVAGVPCLVSRTGYTGEDGFELYIPAQSAQTVFDALMEQGGKHGMLLCGLGCRDTLRLEARYLLYGNDMTDDTNPLEAGLGWVTKLDRPTDFVGKTALLRIKEEGVTRRLRGLVLTDRGVIRHDYPIFSGDAEVGIVTSGGYAPTLEKSIGLGYIDVAHAEATHVQIEIRGRRLSADVTKKPFYKRND